MSAFAMRPRLLSALPVALAISALTAGCSLSDGGYAPGELGNGGFYFSCDDAVACTPYSGDAAKFPKAVSLGSTFAVRFVPKSGSGLDIRVNEAAPDRGITVAPVGEVYVSRGAKGMAAIKTGYATLASRDAAGQLVDYVVVRVAKPDALVVYAADETSTDPPLVSAVSLARGERRAFRAFAQENKANLAGSLAMDWASSNPGVVEVESTTEGKVTVVARSAGTATLQATGGTFTQAVTIQVSP
jgi:hypothetical protein